MSEEVTFRELVLRVRAGDAQAAEELVRRYEPTIRLMVRRRLTDPALRRLLDSADICQSVLASFFVRAAAGQYDLDSPEQLLKLLGVIARNKLANQVQHHRADRRDYHRTAGSAEQRDPVDQGASPSHVVASQELLDEVRKRLSPEERHLAELRAAGRAWADIAAELGGTPDGLRMQLSRAIDRISRELGLDDG
jgi:RNA polymerase sigma-70 factor (ECF subfamily)